jgi:membrane protease YdiL (CAAX protease family)
VYALALVCGFVGHFVQAPAVIGLTALFALAKYSTKPEIGKGLKTALFAGVVVLSLALALHLVPGFKNPLLVENIKFSPSSAPFTQYANFDKASVGLVLVLFFCARVSSVRELGSVLRKAAPATVALAVVVLGLSLLTGLTRIDVKVPGFTAAFLATNLLFTCVAEEAFFRGLLQPRLSAALSKTRFGEAVAIAVSGILFGAVHLAGGMTYALLATVAGLGYAYLYSKTTRIEAPVFAHFLVNALHFLLLTYPQVA